MEQSFSSVGRFVPIAILIELMFNSSQSLDNHVSRFAHCFAAPGPTLANSPDAVPDCS